MILLKYFLIPLTWAIVSVMVKSQTTAPVPATEQTTILWSLAPCQSAFWIPSTSSEFTQNWITYQYEGNPLSQFGECIFTLESDPNSRIEMIIQQVHLFDNGVSVPPPCLQLYDVKADGNVVLLKKECSVVLSTNLLESVSTFTDTNLAVISTTIRYGSFQLQARAVPRNFGTPTKVSPTTTMAPATSPATETTPTVTVTTKATPTTSAATTTTTTTTTTAKPASVVVTPGSRTASTDSFGSSSLTDSLLTAPTRSLNQPRVFIKMVSELNAQHPQYLGN